LDINLDAIYIVHALHTARPEFGYTYAKLQDWNTVKAHVVGLVHQFQASLGMEDHILVVFCVVCCTKDQVNSHLGLIQPMPFKCIAGHLECDTDFLHWHSGIALGSGSTASPVLIGTISVSHGIDQPNITHVIVAELPDTMDIYEQSFGQVGQCQQATQWHAVFSGPSYTSEEHGNSEIIALTGNKLTTICLPPSLC
jgi:hypothetical protein